MSAAVLSAPPGWTMALQLFAHLGAGLVLGTLYFRNLSWTASRFIRGAPVAVTCLMMAARFVLLGAVLTLTSLEGALPLLVTAMGLLIARFATMRRIRDLAP